MAEEQERTANVVLTADVDPYRQQVQAAGRDTVRLTDQVDKLTKSLDRLAKSAGNKLMIFGAGSAAGVTATTIAFAKFEKQMTSLRVNAEVTGRSYDKMERDVNKLRRTYGLTTTTAVELQRTILGFKDSTAPVEKLTSTFVKLGAATGEAPQVLAQGMLQLQRSMGLPQRDSDKLANTFADLSIKSGQSASSIINFSNAIAPIGRIAGMSTAEIAGVSTAFVKAGQDGYTAANAFNKMLSDIMTSTQNGSPDLAKYANLIGVTVSQFKDMNKTDAITQVFDEINRMGPDAISVLNRLGLDGMRMQRAIAGVSSQSGGIGTAITQAVSAYNASSDNALNKGSKVGLDGISDQMARLSESTKMFGESVGSAFEGPAKIMIGALEKMASAANAVGGSWLGKAAAWAIGLAGPLAILTGGLVKFAGTLGTLALFRGMTSNFLTQGVRDRWTQRETNGPLRPGQFTPAGRAINDNRANWVNRGMYSTGQLIGGIIGPQQPGYISRALGTIPRMGAVGMDLLKGTFSPLVHPLDPSARVRMWSTAAERRAGLGFGPGGVLSNSVIRGQNMGYNLFGDRERPPVFGGLGANTGQFLRSGAGFLGGAAGAVGGLGVIGARTGANVIGMGARGLMGAMGGPLGLAFMGGTAAFGASSYLNSKNSLEGVVGAGADNSISLMDSYNASVGKATTALQDFSSALSKAADLAPRSMAQATNVTDKDVNIALAPGRKLTESRIADLTADQARMLLGSQMKQGDPTSVQAMKLDLIQAFGARPAESILNGGQFDVGRYYAGIAGTSTRKLGFQAGEATDSQFQFLETELKRQTAEAQKKGGLEAAGMTTRANLNQFIQAFGAEGKNGNLQDAEYRQAAQFLNKVYLGGKGQVGQAEWNDVQMPDIVSSFKKGGTTGALKEFYGQLLNAEDSGTAPDQLFANLGFTRAQVQAQVKAGAGSLFSTSTYGVKDLYKNNVTGYERFENEIARSGVGSLIMKDPAISKALDPGNTANQNVQIQATDELVAAMRKQGSSYAEIDRRLLEFQGRVQDTSDPLYQLASSARAVAGQQLSYKLPYMSTAGRFGEAAAGYGQREAGLAPAPGKNLTPDAAKERKENEQAWQAYMASTQQWLEQQYIAQREFNISQERAQEDFGLMRARAEEDYQLSRRRAEQQFAMSRRDAFFDFHLSRKRAEQDFHHQQEVMTEQAAKSMMNIYDRVLVQRTWSGDSLLTNAQDQMERMQQQKRDLGKVRKMGLNKDVIQQLGFADPANAQQLSRFLEDIIANPSLVGKFNKNVKGRLNAAGKLVKDEGNQQWEEMRRQFRLSMSRGSEDFNRSMSRNRRNFNITMDQAAEDYGKSMNRMAADFDKQQARAQKDLLRMQRELTWDLEKTLEKSAGMFEGYIDKQVDKMIENLRELGLFLKNEMPRFFENWELSPGISQFGSNPMDRHRNQGEALGANTAGKGMPVAPNGSGRYAGNQQINNNTNITGPVTVQSQDPKDMGRKLERETRRKRLIKGTTDKP